MGILKKGILLMFLASTFAACKKSDPAIEIAEAWCECGKGMVELQDEMDKLQEEMDKEQQKNPRKKRKDKMLGLVAEMQRGGEELVICLAESEGIISENEDDKEFEDKVWRTIEKKCPRVYDALQQ